MKILQINKFYYLRGGAERYVLELSKTLKENGHIVTVFSMHDSRNESTPYQKYFIDKVDVHKFSIKNIIKIFYNYDAVRKLKKLIKEEKLDIAHLHNIDYQISAAIIKVLKKYNLPVIQTLHDYKLICPNKKLFSKNEICEKCQGGKYYNCIFRKCAKNSFLKSFLAMLEAYWHGSILKSYNQVDLFIAPSEFMKKIMVKFGVSAEKIKVVYNFTPPHIHFYKKKECREGYLLYFGRFTKEKGVAVLLEAMKKIKTNLKLKIVGEGAEYKNYKLQIKNYELNDTVELLGPKYGEELGELIKNAKAVILPSLWYENMPMSLLEAMAMGKVVIASRLGGIPEIIKDKENGLLFTAGDSGDLAQKIDLLNSLNLNALGELAKTRVNSFNINSHCQKIMEIYKHML